MELIIITFNSVSLISYAQRASVQLLIGTLNADLYGISETHLKTKHNEKFTEYNIIRKDDNSTHALLVRKDYFFEEIAIENLQTSSAVAAIVKTIGGKRMLVVSVYIKCKSRTEQLGHDLHVWGTLQLKSKHLLLGGDFNSMHTSWGEKAANINRGPQLKWIHNPFSLTNIEMVLPDIPTRPSNQFIFDYFLLSDETKQSFQVKSCKKSLGMSIHFTAELKLSSS